MDRWMNERMNERMDGRKNERLIQSMREVRVSDDLCVGDVVKRVSHLCHERSGRVGEVLLVESGLAAAVRVRRPTVGLRARGDDASVQDKSTRRQMVVRLSAVRVQTHF